MKKPAKLNSSRTQKTRPKPATPQQPNRFSKLKPNPAIPDSVRRSRQADRLAQLLRVLEFLQSRLRRNVGAMARELKCSQRTIYRHFNTLEVFGITPHYDKERDCYYVTNGSWFPTINVSPEEALGQATVVAITKASGLDVSVGSQPISRKLATKSNDTIAQILDDGEKLFLVGGLQLADHRYHREIIRTAQWALLKHRQLSGIYKSPYKSDPQHLELLPWRICLVKQAWYLIAVPAGASEPRTYRLARFENLSMLDSPAVPPDEFDLREYFGDAWTVYRGHTKYDVKIRFTREAADLVTETEWHHTQTTDWKNDGSVMLSFRVDGLEEIVHWVLGWSDRSKVLQPRELQQMVKDHLKRAWGQYER